MKYLVMLSWVVVLGLGCASTPDKAPAVISFEKSRSGVWSSHESALETAEAANAYDVKLRYNPARCDCPKYEIEVYGRWVRVYLIGPTPQLAAVDRFAAEVEKTNRGPETGARGRLTSGERKSSRRVAYPVFELVALR